MLAWVVAVWSALWAVPEAASGAEANVVLRNSYIAITVNARERNTGRFSVATTGGDPQRPDDDGKPLIYGVPDPGPWTSYTTVRVDDQDYVFGGRTADRPGRRGTYGTVVEAPHVAGDAIEAAWQLGPLVVRQRLSIARSSTTGLLDSVRIAYVLENRDKVAHQVGLRVVLDTMLGENDGAPFRVGERAITTDTMFAGAEVPDYWQAFDSLATPHVMAQGTLRGPGLTPPDRVYFTNWGALADGLWDFSFEPGRDFTRLGEFELDSATALMWLPRTLGPGESVTFATQYGLGGITIAPGRLAVGLTAPAEVVGDGRTPFTVVAYVENSGTGDARGVVARLTLPPGFRLAPGEPVERPLSQLPSGQTAQARWRVIPPAQGTGSFTLGVRVEAENSEPNRAERTIRVVSPAQVELALLSPQARLEVKDDRWSPLPLPVTAQVRNRGDAPSPELTLTWSAPQGLELAPGEIATKPVGPLRPGETVQVTWYVQPTYVFGNLPFQVSAAGLEQPLRTAGLVQVPLLPARIGVTVHEPDGRPDQVVRAGEFVEVEVVAVNVKGLYGFSLDLLYDPRVLEPVGGPLAVDRGELLVWSGFEAKDGQRQYLQWAAPQIEVTGGQLARIHLAGERRPAPALDVANGSLAKIRFRARLPEGRTDLGGSPLILENVRPYDARGQRIPLVTTDGAVRVVP